MALPNPYATRLQEFSSFAFNDLEVFNLAGRWKHFFSSRMGSEPTRTILEIGCSNVVFLSTIAKAHPENAFIGIDWKYKILYKGAQKVDAEKLKNVALLRVRAQEFQKIFGEVELDEVWFFFPDPWAKKSQLKNRLFREDFLMEVSKALKPGGKFYFKTDHPGYFQWALTLFGQPLPELPSYNSPAPDEKSYRAKQVNARRLGEPGLLPPKSERLLATYRLDYSSTNYWESNAPKTLFSTTHTLFERGFVRDGLPIYYVELTRI